MDPAVFSNLDPDLADFVRMIPDMGNALDDVPAARRMINELMPTATFPHEDELDITDTVLPGSGAAVRIYRPLGAEGRLPGILHIHGGGFCLGDLETEHGGAVALAHQLQAVVVSVDYRLAPEHPYPAGLDDCYAALELLVALTDVDSDRIAVHGNSAGGALAAGVALASRDRGGPAIRFQSLGIPVLDDGLDTPSMRTFVDTPLWSRRQAEQSWKLYLAGQEADQYAAPARALDLTGLPAAYVVTCELDPLRDEGLTYAMPLLASGVSVELHNFPGTFHGSSIVRGAAVVRRMETELINVLRRALSPRR